MNLFISPWKSYTPRALSSHLGTRLKRLDEAFNLHVRSIVNWGCSDLHGCAATSVLNNPGAVRNASSKTKAFMTLTSNKVPTLVWTVSREVAMDWNKKSSIIAHTDVHGHSGAGLTRIGPEAVHTAVPYCELYTRYFQKDTEVRILCIKDGAAYETMFLEKKRILPDRYAEFGLEGKPDWFIRTHSNGWIFSREAEPIPDALGLARSACTVLGLDFAAVDILCKKRSDGGHDCKVGEINTAPGLEGATLEFFKTGLSRLIRNAA